MITDYLLLVIDVFTFFLFFYVTGNSKYKFKDSLIFFLLFYIVFALSAYIKTCNFLAIYFSDLTLSMLFTFINLIVIVLLQKKFLKVETFQACLNLVTYYITSLCLQLLSLLIGYIINIEDLNILQGIYSCLFILFCVIFKDSIAFYYDKVFNYIYRIHAFKNIKLILSIILVLVMSFLSIAIFFKESLSIGFIVCIICVFVNLIILILSYKENVEDKYKIKEMEEKESFNQIHKDFVNSLNEFGHSYNNIMQTLSFAINSDEDDFEEIKKLLNDMLNFNKENNISYKLKYVNIPNTIVASVLSIKLKEAIKLGVALNVNCTGDITTVNINSRNLIDMLGILLDNAIEAAYYSNKVVDINIDFNNKFSFTIENTYKKENDIIQKYGESKGKGIGIPTIKDLCKKNRNISYQIIDKNNKYKVKLKIG